MKKEKGMVIIMGKRLKARWDKGRMFGKMKSGIFAALAACFMLCIFAPLEIYLSNPNEFWYDAYMLFPICLGLFGALLLVSLLFFGVSFLGGDRLYDVALAFYFFVFAGFYAQGNFGVGNLPPFDGTEVDWAQYRGETVWSTVCWLLIAAASCGLLAVLKSERFRRMVSAVSLFLLAVLFSTLAVLGVNGGIFEKKQFLRFTKTDQFEMSTEENFIILLLDAIDEECFWQVWERHPEYREAMADFTFYNNALTGYPYTETALPLMLSGEWYENQEPFQDYKLRVYRDSPFFGELEKRGYSLSIYDDELQFKVGTMEKQFVNTTAAKSSLWDRETFLKRQVKVVGVKYAPWLLKPYCWFDPAKIWHQQRPASGEELFVGKNGDFYEDIQNDAVTYADGKRFKLIHLMGAHVPFYYDQYVNEVDDADYFSCIESSMTVTMAYLEKLKEAGVYDNSIILVLSDHGYNSSGEAVRVAQYNEEESGRQHPVLFIKGLQERHEMQISGAPVSYEDLVGAYEKLLEGCPSDSVFPYQEGEERVRRYFMYNYRDDDPAVEYLHKGYAGDESVMVPTGRVLDYTWKD